MMQSAIMYLIGGASCNDGYKLFVIEGDLSKYQDVYINQYADGVTLEYLQDGLLDVINNDTYILSSNMCQLTRLSLLKQYVKVEYLLFTGN